MIHWEVMNIFEYFLQQQSFHLCIQLLNLHYSQHFTLFLESLWFLFISLRYLTILQSCHWHIFGYHDTYGFYTHTYYKIFDWESFLLFWFHWILWYLFVACIWVYFPILHWSHSFCLSLTHWDCICCYLCFIGFLVPTTMRIPTFYNNNLPLETCCQIVAIATLHHSSLPKHRSHHQLVFIVLLHLRESWGAKVSLDKQISICTWSWEEMDANGDSTCW